VDETLVRTDSAGTVSLLVDALGSTLALTDASGAITTQYAYGPYGQASLTGGASTNNTQFTGRDNDSTGLYYYRARYLSPVLARFISDDPSGLDAGINATAYVGNRPITLVDPLGLYAENPDDPPATGKGPGGDQWHGHNDRDFQDWFHKNWKDPGAANAGKDTLDEAQRVFDSLGSPKRDPRGDWDRSKRQLFSPIPPPTSQQILSITAAGTLILLLRISVFVAVF
jgi:RHS repeat-associated protein